MEITKQDLLISQLIDLGIADYSEQDEINDLKGGD